PAILSRCAAITCDRPRGEFATSPRAHARDRVLLGRLGTASRSALLRKSHKTGMTRIDPWPSQVRWPKPNRISRRVPRCPLVGLDSVFSYYGLFDQLLEIRTRAQGSEILVGLQFAHPVCVFEQALCLGPAQQTHRQVRLCCH